MNSREMEERALDARIVAALERVPEVSQSIPADFAARVAAQVPARRAVVGPTPSRWGATTDVGVGRCVAGCSLRSVAAAKGLEQLGRR